jgi:hypothetical protein
VENGIHKICDKTISLVAQPGTHAGSPPPQAGENPIFPGFATSLLYLERHECFVKKNKNRAGICALHAPKMN